MLYSLNVAEVLALGVEQAQHMVDCLERPDWQAHVSLVLDYQAELMRVGVYLTCWLGPRLP